jgi:DNA mismatch repair protein MSH2
VLRLLERQDSNTFVVFGESAEIVSTALFNSTASLVEPFGPEYPAMCVLNNANNSSNQLALLLQEFLLLRDGWRIEIWTWDGLRKVFKCTKRASPGNLEAIEDLLTLFDSSNEQISQQSSSSSASSVSPVIAALIVGTGEGNDTQISLSWCDLSSMRIGFLSFQDNPLLTTLEASLIQLGVRELLIGSSAGSLKDGNLDKVRQITSASEIVLQSLKSSEFFSCDDTKGMEIDLARLVGEDVVRMSEMSPALSKTMRCLFVYLNLLGVDSNIGSFKLVNHNLGDFARLDEAALTSLNIFPKHGDVSKGNNNFSLFGFLDHCKTTSGSRTLNQWLRQPLANVQLIENRLDLVEMFVDCCEGRHRLRESVLRGIPDMTKLLKKLLRARSSLQVMTCFLILYF